MLADEPVAALDPVTSRQVMGDLQKINRELGITTLVNPVSYTHLTLPTSDLV